jgi:hypothetical protein
MSNYSREVLGNLRSLIFVIFVCRSAPVAFPLDPQSHPFLLLYRTRLEVLANAVLRASGMNLETNLREVWEYLEHFLPGGEVSYDEGTTDLELSLYCGDRTLRHFSYSNKEALLRETRQIFVHTLEELADKVLWVRVDYTEGMPQVCLSPLTEEVRRIASAVQALLPEDSDILDVASVVLDAVRKWVGSEAAQKASTSAMAEDSGFCKVFEEAQAYCQ